MSGHSDVPQTQPAIRSSVNKVFPHCFRFEQIFDKCKNFYLHLQQLLTFPLPYKLISYKIYVCAMYEYSS